SLVECFCFFNSLSLFGVTSLPSGSITFIDFIWFVKELLTLSKYFCLKFFCSAFSSLDKPSLVLDFFESSLIRSISLSVTIQSLLIIQLHNYFFYISSRLLLKDNLLFFLCSIIKK